VYHEDDPDRNLSHPSRRSSLFLPLAVSVATRQFRRALKNANSRSFPPHFRFSLVDHLVCFLVLRLDILSCRKADGPVSRWCWRTAPLHGQLMRILAKNNLAHRFAMPRYLVLMLLHLCLERGFSLFDWRGVLPSWCLVEPRDMPYRLVVLPVSYNLVGRKPGSYSSPLDSTRNLLRASASFPPSVASHREIGSCVPHSLSGRFRTPQTLRSG